MAIIKLKYAAQFLPMKGITGVYWLWFGNECRYVGKSDCIYSRMKTHGRRFHGFSKFEWMPLNQYVNKMNYVNSKRLLTLMEALQIARLNPTENRKRPCPGNLYFNGQSSDFLEANKAFAKLSGVLDICIENTSDFSCIYSEACKASNV